MIIELHVNRDEQAGMPWYQASIPDPDNPHNLPLYETAQYMTPAMALSALSGQVDLAAGLNEEEN